jgi:hypothetical protein
MLLRSAPILVLAALCLTAPSHLRADVYKWVDERGAVSYGDTPPQGAKGVRALDLKSGIDTVIPGIPKEELERLRERDTQMRLRQLEAEVEELRAREAAQPAASPPSEPVHYGYPVYWYGRTWPGRGGIGREHRPAQPIASPSSSSLRRVPDKRPLMSSGPSSSPGRHPPVPNKSSDILWKR